MRLLLDTHAFLWWNTKDFRLAPHLRAAICDPDNVVHISAATVWEVAIKRASGKLDFEGNVSEAVEGHGFIGLAISTVHAEMAGGLPTLHKDPFDRLLVAQAQMEGLTLVTVDDQILRYQVPHL